MNQLRIAASPWDEEFAGVHRENDTAQPGPIPIVPPQLIGMSEKPDVTFHHHQCFSIPLGNTLVAGEYFLELCLVIQLHVDSLDEDEMRNLTSMFQERVRSVYASRKEGARSFLSPFRFLDPFRLNLDPLQHGIP